MPNLPGIMLSAVGEQLWLHHRPAPGRLPLDEAALGHLLASADGGPWPVDAGRLEAARQRCNRENAEFDLLLAERAAARVQIVVAPDAMSASVTLAPDDRGPVTWIELQAALAGAGVVSGLDEAALQQACAAGLPTTAVAATGRAPVDGVDARFEVLVTDTRDRGPKVDAHGFADFREHGDVPVVDVGQALMRRIPPTPGTPGCDVRGQLLPQRPGRDEPFASPLDGAAIAPDDPWLLRATRKGQPVRCGHGVMVEPVVRVKAVNMATGNVRFDGTVQVDGDVLAGMKVQASGDIVVGGTVEGGDLSAGGDIRVAGGIIAHAKAQAGASLAARFAENSSLRAALAIVVDDMALQCELQAGERIVVGAKSRQRGRLSGGSALAMKLVKAPTLGTPTGGLTRVHVGVDPELEARHAELLQRLDKHKADEEKLQLLVQYLVKHGDPKGMLERARGSWQQALQAWGVLLQQKEELDAKLAAVREARIEITAGVDGDLELAFGRKMCRLSQDFGAGAFSLQDDGRIAFTDARGKVAGIG